MGALLVIVVDVELALLCKGLLVPKFKFNVKPLFDKLLNANEDNPVIFVPAFTTVVEPDDVPIDAVELYMYG